MHSSLNKEILNLDFGEKTLSYVNHLYTYALLITGDENKAEKILINTYSKAFSTYKNISDETDINLWLTIIIMSICKNDSSLKNKKMENQNIEDVNLLSNFNTERLQGEPPFRITQKLISLIAGLPLELKEVLILSDILKFNNDAAAGLIAAPEQIVKKRIVDARNLLLTNLLSYDSKLKQNQTPKLNTDDKKDLNREDEENFKNGTNTQIFVQSYLDNNLQLQRVRDAVYFRIVKKFAPNQKHSLVRENTGERKGLVAASTVAMFILIAVLILISKPPTLNYKQIADEQFGGNNIFIRLINNYSLFTEGTFAGSMVWGGEEYLKKHLETSGFESKPVFFNFTNWQIENVFTTEFRGKILANYVYKNSDDEYLYIYQVPSFLVEEKKIIKMSENLYDLLKSGECFFSRKDEIYLLKKSPDNYFGYAVSKQSKELIIEICTR